MPSPPPLPGWINTACWLGLAVFFALGVSSIGLAMAWVRSPMNNALGRPLPQPIEFDHRHHVQDDGIDCIYCHFDAEKSERAGLPDTALCMGCHAQIHTESPLLAPLRKSWQSKRPLVWQRVTNVPDFVYFNHAVHVHQGVPCATCHGDVASMARVYPAVHLSMGFCLDCHRNPGRHPGVPSTVSPGPTDCVACHR